MNIYDTNMKALSEVKPYLYKKLLDRVLDEDKLDSIELIPTLDGDSALVLRKQDEVYRFNSMYSPKYEASRWIKQFNFKNLDIVFSMFGFGNGSFAREILSALGDKGHLIIFEPSVEIFIYNLNNCDITDLLQNDHIFIFIKGVNEADFISHIHRMSWINLKSQIITKHPVYDLVFVDELNYFMKQLNDNNKRIIVNKNTGVYFGRRIIANNLENIKEMDRFYLTSELVDKFSEDVPAIIVAAGPSLEKNIHYLKNAKGRAVIFAVDTAMKYLLDKDIIPDFIVTLDPQKELSSMSDPRCEKIPLFAILDSKPEYLKNCKDKIFLYSIYGYMKSLCKRMNQDTVMHRLGGSVATAAFSVCCSIGFRRIILIGQDLAYDGDYTHAGQINDHNITNKNITMVEGIHGDMVKTRQDWYQFLKWFENAIALLEDIEVIDATEGGAKIQGTKILSLKEALDLYSGNTVDIETVLNSIHPLINGENRSQFIDQLKQDLKELENIKSIAIEAVSLSERLINKYNKSLEDTPYSLEKARKLRDYNEKVENQAIYQLIDVYIGTEVLDGMADINIYTDDDKSNKIKTYEHSIKIYGAILRAIEHIQPLMEDTVGCLEAMI